MATTNAADQLVKLLPTATQLTHRPFTGEVPAGEALIATLVGSQSADLALVLADPAELGNDGALSTTDLTAPAFEAAAKTIAVGVLSDVRTDDASGVFADPSADVYELSTGGRVAGWFAVRVRDNAAAKANGGTASNLHRINDVEMALTVVIGHTTMSVRDVMAMEPGTVVELDRSAGAPADIKLNGKLIALGEVVVVDQDYAVRITRILQGEGAAA